MLTRIAAAMGCAPADDDDLVEAVRLLVAERDEAEAEVTRLREAMRRQSAAVRMHQSAREQMDAHDQATLASLAGQDRAALIEELAAARRERDDWNARATALENERDEARAEAAAALEIADGHGVPAEVRDRGWQWRPSGNDTAFAPPFSTIRVCRGCGCLVAGGPTACNRCAESPTGGA